MDGKIWKSTIVLLTLLFFFPMASSQYNRGFSKFHFPRQNGRLADWQLIILPKLMFSIRNRACSVYGTNKVFVCSFWKVHSIFVYCQSANLPVCGNLEFQNSTTPTHCTLLQTSVCYYTDLMLCN